MLRAWRAYARARARRLFGRRRTFFFPRKTNGPPGNVGTGKEVRRNARRRRRRWYAPRAATVVRREVPAGLAANRRPAGWFSRSSERTKAALVSCLVPASSSCRHLAPAARYQAAAYSKVRNDKLCNLTCDSHVDSQFDSIEENNSVRRERTLRRVGLTDGE